MSTVATLPARPQRKSRTRKPPARTLRLLVKPDSAGPGLLALSIDGVKTVYWLREIATALPGRAFELRKFRSAESYHVLLQPTGESSCTCPGGTYRHHCKHADACAKLIGRGLL